MPFATFKSVREVSSEDSNHLAENLLKQTGKKWKIKTPGEKMAYVILELEEPQQIVGIDIGNEHSAFVEVLVGKAGCTPNDFTEILITCSFMTPIESRNSTNPNRVRCFNQEALVSTAVPHKWQLVKVVCTQPFNKHVQYGLSFIKLHVSESARKEAAAKSLVPEKFLPRKISTDSNESGTKLHTIGKFKLREDSPDSESEGNGALFKRWKTASSNTGHNTTLSTAAAIREASTPQGLRRLSAQDSSKAISKPIVKSPPSATRVQQNKDDVDDAPMILDRNRTDLLFGDDKDDDDAANSSKNQRLQKQIEIERERLRLENENLKKQMDKQKRKSRDSLSPVARDTKTDLNSSKVKAEKQEQRHKRHSSPTDRPAKKVKSAAKRQYRPFNQLLRGVVLVISGIQNPDRADLRSKALAMGAKYKADWESGCTHLICAFKNTPKYNQVKGKGKIVTRSWIEQCYALKKYLPWRRYALDSADLAQPESDEEILDESLAPAALSDEEDVVMCEEPTTSRAAAVAANKDVSSNKRELDECEQLETQALTSGSDTEDEIRRVKQSANNARHNKENVTHTQNVVKETIQTKDVFEVSTDEEDYLTDKLKMCADAGRVC